ncbi:MAG: tetratricopeptide repeat protein [Nitrospinota bacterium]|nr:tetratricopeptide repeat protein [Nitrospinota bacterium]
MSEDNKDRRWKDKTGRKYRTYGAEQEKRPGNEQDEENRETSASGESDSTVAGEGGERNEEAGLQESDVEAVEASAEEAEEEEKEGFDLEAQIELFRAQIEEDPENCIHHYNLGEALEEVGESEEALLKYQKALECDTEKEFSAIIHYSIGNHHYQKLISGIQGTVVRSSVGLHSAHKAGDTITEVHAEDYKVPIDEFESAIADLYRLKADDDIVDYVNKNAPQKIADTHYKWGSDLIDKSRQIENYGEEIKDVKESLRHLKRTLEIDPNHSQASLMVKYAKKMLQEGWECYDEYGFVAKEIQGTG